MTDTSSRNRSDGGFTLIEIMVSIGLITVALMAVFRLQAQNLDLQHEARFVTTANLLLQQRLSRIQSREGVEVGKSSGDFGEDFPEFTYEEEILEVEDFDNLVKVRVGVILEQGPNRRDLWSESYLHRASRK